MPELAQDLRYLLRLLRKTPTVTAVAVLSLALGIGANTAIFGVINALMLRSLPVRDPQRLVSIGELDPAHPDGGDEISLAMFNEIRRRVSALSDVFAWSGGGISNFEAAGVRYAGSLDEVSGDYFSALGVRPVLGRVLTRSDAPLDGRPSAQVAVITYACWRHRFAGDPDVIGKTLRVDGIPLSIVGVSPEDFAGIMIDGGPEATVPIGFTGRELKYRENLWYNAFARLKPGFTVTQAQAQIQAFWPGILKAAVPDSYRGIQLKNFLALRSSVQSAARGHSFLRRRLGRPLQILMALVGAVLLIACVNLANLLLARAAARQHEFGIRIALGAARGRLVRMMLAEALLLSLTGATLGLIIARWMARYLLTTFWTGYVPLSVDPSPDARVLLFTAGLAILTGALFGIVPEWRVSRSDPSKTLSLSSRTIGGRTGRLSRALITAQVALSLMLLLGATLFVRSLQNLQTVDTGYRRNHLLIMQLFPQPGHGKIPNRTEYYHEVVRHLSSVPGVESVSYLHMGPATSFEFKNPVSANSVARHANAVEEWAGPGIFHTMGMHMLAGREFTWHDDERAPRVAVISKSLAEKLFPKQNPIGQAIDVGTEPEHKGLTIVGVMSYAVTRRTTEIGVRMALGAVRSDVLFMVLGEVLRLLAIGIAIAIPLAIASGKLVSGMLFGVTVTDPVVIAIASSTLTAVAIIAGFLPARRASRVDPMIALRAE